MQVCRDRVENYLGLRSRAAFLRPMRYWLQIMPAYQSKKIRTTVAKPTKTRMAMLAEELFPTFLVPVVTVEVGEGAAEGEVTTAGALKRKVYDPERGSSVALRSV